MKKHDLVALTALVPLALLGLAACGSDDELVDVTQQPAAEAGGAGEAGGADAAAGGPGDRQFPGASGEVVDVTGSIAQVRDQASGQTAVTWTDDTAFTTTVTLNLSDLAVGECVMVDEDANTIRVIGSDGSCEIGGPGGGFGGGRSGGDADGDRPAPPEGGMPDGERPERPEGAEGMRFDAFIVGTVTDISAAALTIDAVTMSLPGGPDADADADAMEPTTESRTVATDDDTVITGTGDATAAAVKAGVCVVAQGEADSTGAVTARTIAISEKVDGSCSTGFPGGRMGGARQSEGAGVAG